ncbi:MAG: aminoacyl-tRNA hydrolase [candidate division Zixibacteria bacterium]|nr:aminoacyl-tRNA hydrolase [candidate division Zixibacteria bacterium]NIR65449.1 aminoacyl-tRNA hydrolase [candidate division Zixibacteria bacterium]NIS15349.1 aminoacyl-tRNA hydrolase [candidate division Zixibacteria bacterium]NIS47140.1 aminoacyl-tRNA hydrolase [candidate division Zixibacteria bacterium]NIT51874.1 aminoacyl-tRNA hydrolase [candidate division Zixibacteria bacterium]
MARYKLLAGLGNPGKKYAKTRHNLGFMVLDYLADRNGRKFKSGKGKWKEARLELDGKEIWAIMPQTYMNLSGQAVAEFCNYLKIEPEEVLVVCDDINLPLGKIRIRDSGSAGGHNGLKDIIESLGSDRFSRIRLGIDLPPEGEPSEAYVLKPFGEKDQKIVKEMIENAVRAASMVISEGVTAAQNEYN